MWTARGIFPSYQVDKYKVSSSTYVYKLCNILKQKEKKSSTHNIIEVTCGLLDTKCTSINRR